MSISRESFVAVRSEGALLPPDLLRSLLEDHPQLDGLTAESYKLFGERLNEAISHTWNRLRKMWSDFQTGSEKLAHSDPGTHLSRTWMTSFLYQLDYGRLKASPDLKLEDTRYAISHTVSNIPIHLVGCNVSLDSRTPGVVGASRSSPHGLMQEFLNRSPDHLWGLVSNGRILRVLRDSVSLVRMAYVEFDLGACRRNSRLEYYPCPFCAGGARACSVLGAHPWRVLQSVRASTRLQKCASLMS